MKLTLFDFILLHNSTCTRKRWDSAKTWDSGNIVHAGHSSAAHHWPVRRTRTNPGRCQWHCCQSRRGPWL